MGNLEKAGVLVVVALLAVILVVAFLNYPDQNGTAPPMLARNAASRNQDIIPPSPANVLPPPPDPGTITPTPRTDDAGGRGTPVRPPFDEKPPIEPTPPAPKPPVTPGYPKTVKVKPGESLWSISLREYGPKLGPQMHAAIAAANPRVKPEALKVGMELTLPAPQGAAVDVNPDDGKQPPAPKPVRPEPQKKASKLPFVPQ